MILEFIKQKFSISKKNANSAFHKVTNNESHFQYIDSNFFPYSSLVAPDVMITKNDDIFQIIEITLDDFK
ncbi:MAG: hypothetical protein RL208_413, partial [Pseudomonadota bacterium]